MTSWLRPLSFALLLSASACGDDAPKAAPSDEDTDPNDEEDDGETGETLDAGLKDATVTPTRDASVTPPAKDGGADAGSDAGKVMGLDAGGDKDAATPANDAAAPVKDAEASKDAEAPVKDGSPSNDSGTNPSAPDAGADHCENRFCFDAFDCYIFNPDAVDCGFTACVGFVCQK